jgi:lipoate-protein ligase A
VTPDEAGSDPAFPGDPFPDDLFNVERYRHEPRVVIRRIRPSTTMLVVGSTQDGARADARALERFGVSLARRRSGGGAVLVSPGDPLWMDVWVPADDRHWHPDVNRAPIWVGEWWVRALERVGVRGTRVHRGPATRTPLASLVCFGGIGPGEVLIGDRKLVGISPWRARQGALFSSALYHHFDAEQLARLVLPLDRVSLADELALRAIGLDEIGGADLDELETALQAADPPARD